ncbi:MAG TPA: hypothetical protein PKN91_01920 [Steroidobacteraceae bacterium]|nr:hypothetical protein [Steroidobacteraceae bacterium]
MPNELDPIVGQWYVYRDKGGMFRVVAADAAEDYIEIQSFDGDVEELDTIAWQAMDIETAEPPEDWTGPFDDIEPDDLGLSETGTTPQDWRQPLESVEAAEEPWQDARSPDELEEEEEGRPPEVYAEEQETTRDRAR